MSHRASAYVKALTHMPTSGKKLRSAQKLMLMVLADYHNDEDKRAWPSLARLADESLVSRRHVITLVQECVDGGILKVEERRDAKGNHRSNLYQFIELDPSEESSPPVAKPSEPIASPPSEVQSSPPSELASSPKPLINRYQPKRYSSKPKRKNDGEIDPDDYISPGGKFYNLFGRRNSDEGTT